MYCCFPKQNRKTLKKQNNKIKLLLLGTDESGKSTFIRQMKILYGNGFADKERKFQIKIIHQNMFNSMQHMISAMEMLGIAYEKEENANKNATLIMYVDCENAKFLEDPYLSAIKELWNDSGIQECYMRRREYQLNDSTKYYLTNIDRIAEPDYMPTDQDILRISVATTGLVEHRFKIKKKNVFMIDVGGQQSERRKWIHCIDNVKSIIFLSAISEYDQVSMKLNQGNRLVESINLFKSIYNWFEDTSIILFLNKTDILDEKIMYSHIDEFFPKFKGPRQDSESARIFILDMFKEVCPKLKNSKMYSHFTCATDTQNIKVVFAAVQDTILDEHLKTFGLV